MAEEFWTDYPSMKWWKLEPARWLMSISFKNMPSAARGPYCCLCFRLMCEKLPGLILNPSDHKQLADWSMLKEKDWKKVREDVFTGFVKYRDGSFHQETIKELFRARCVSAHEDYEKGMNSAIKRAKENKKPTDHLKVLPFFDPYHLWGGRGSGGGLEGVSRGSDSKIAVFNSEINGSGGGLEGVSRGSKQKRREEIRQESYLNQAADAPPPEAADAAADPPPIPLGRFLKNHIIDPRKAGQS